MLRPDGSTPHGSGISSPLLAFGQVRHRRLRPRGHAFSYPTTFLLLPMRSLRNGPRTALCRNRPGLMSFHDRDHGDGRDDALAWIEDVLVHEGVDGVDGEIWLQTYPRMLGYVFKPVSFWYCHAADGRLVAVLAEVNNTFGERHCYLVQGGHLAWGREMSAQKVFHVSPFCSVQGRYRFRFMRTASRILARVDHDDEIGPLLETSVSGQLEVLSRASVQRAFWSAPLMTLALIARIHWQAWKLWRKRVPWFGKPVPPTAFVSR